MDLTDYRKQIDDIDAQLVALFQRRMDVACGIADYKREHQIPVLDAGREQAKLRDIRSQVRPDLQNYASVLYTSLFELSRAYQNRQLNNGSALSQRIAQAMEQTPSQFPQAATVAVCGVEGAYAQIAAQKLFSDLELTYVRDFESVFTAVEEGRCTYGVVPIENSTAGSVDQIYDLMLRHNIFVVRSTRLKIEHQFLAKEGTELSQIREVFSHPQAISQCCEFLKTLGPNVKITAVSNTAMAAELVSRSPRTDTAALCSRNCMELYDLQCLQEDVQDQNHNCTRFLCIAKELEIYPDADRTTVMFTTEQSTGALYKILARFYALGIKVIKLESRPIPNREFESVFYLDLETSVHSEAFLQTIAELSADSTPFTYLGSYTEVI